MHSNDSRVNTLEEALSESERVFRVVGECNFGPFGGEGDVLYSISMDNGRAYFDELVQWRKTGYAPEQAEASGKAAACYETSLDDLLVYLTHQDASEELHGQIIRIIGLLVLLEKDLRVLVADVLESSGESVPEKQKYVLVGGRNHSLTAETDGDVNEYRPEVFRDDESTVSMGHETYRKRRFEGVEFGEGFECYGLSEDDRVETKELARFLLQQQSGLSEGAGES